MFASNNSPFNGDEILALKRAREATQYPLEDMPLIVLTRGIPIDPSEPRGVEREQERQRLKADLAALSHNGKQITASGPALAIIFISTSRCSSCKPFVRS